MSHGWHLSGAVCVPCEVVRVCWGCDGCLMGGTCAGPCECRVRTCGCVGGVMGVSHGWHLCGAMCVPCEDVRVCWGCDGCLMGGTCLGPCAV